MNTRARFAAVLAAVLLAASAGCGADDEPAPRGTALVGTFRLTPGACSGAGASGTWFRMIQPGGTLEKGKFFENPDSPCRDKSFTPQRPGTDGGLVTGRYQPGPARPFDASGNAGASAILEPGTFTAIGFAISTAPIDPQSGKKVAKPEIRVDAEGHLSGQISAWSAAWNNLYFNQGSPKPDGSSPGLTAPVSGTYDEQTGAFVLTWASQVVGGPFNGFTGAWHLEGTFEPAG